MVFLGRIPNAPQTIVVQIGPVKFGSETDYKSSTASAIVWPHIEGMTMWFNTIVIQLHRSYGTIGMLNAKSWNAACFPKQLLSQENEELRVATLAIKITFKNWGIRFYY